jgi:hypothetical protein
MWKNLGERGRLFLKQFIAGNLTIEKERFLEDLVEEFRRNVGKEREDQDEAGQYAYEKKKRILDLAEKLKNLREKGRLFLKQFIAGNVLIEKKRFLEDLLKEFRRNAVGEEREDHDEAGHQAYEKKRENF